MTRDTGRARGSAAMIEDIRFALRMLRKNPAFSAVAVATLALGIGANTAMFTLVRAVLLKPLPYAEPGQLFNVFQARPQDRIAGTGWSYPNFAEFLRQNRAFTGLAGTQRHQLTMTGRGEPAVVDTSVVTPELFAVLGEPPLAGRVFDRQDGEAGARPVVILSEALWRGTFGADPQIIGTGIDLDQRAFTVVGVMRSAFRFPSLTKAAQLWIPLAQDPLFGGWMERRAGHWLQVTGRLRAGVSIAQAQEELDAITARLAGEFPAENAGWQIHIVPLQEMIVQNVKMPLWLLLGAVALVLVMACANVANLLLTRATGRAREIAIRTTLGAGRGRIVRQLLSESVVLGVLGGAVGVALAYWGVEGLSSMLPSSVPRVNVIQVDRTVLGFALLLSLVASTAFGLAPAFFAAHPDTARVLREGGRGTGESRGRRRTRHVLAAGEIALAIVLLLAAGLLLRSFSKLLSARLGFDAERVVTADVSLPRFQYATPQQWTAFADELLTHLHAQPGLGRTAVAVPRPIVDGNINLGFDIVGHPPSAGESRTASYVSVSAEYFPVMDIPLIAGRLFDRRDVSSGQRVSVISQAMARRYFPDHDPVGQKIVFGFPPDGSVVREIVGVVGDVRDVAVGQEPGAMMYVPFAQAPFWGANVVVRSPLSAAAVAAAIRREVQKLDRGLPVTGVALMPEAINASLAPSRFRTFLLGAFAVMALILAATGIFGVIAYSVSRRTNEIGIRVALGAARAAIVAMMARETAALTLAGVAVGLPCALAASRVMTHLLFDVSGHDPLTVALVVGALIAAAALAAYVPTRRALRVEPVEALRHE